MVGEIVYVGTLVGLSVVGVVWRFRVCVRFCIFCLIYFIIVLGVGCVGGIVFVDVFCDVCVFRVF